MKALIIGLILFLLIGGGVAAFGYYNINTVKSTMKMDVDTQVKNLGDLRMNVDKIIATFQNVNQSETKSSSEVQVLGAQSKKENIVGNVKRSWSSTRC